MNRKQFIHQLSISVAGVASNHISKACMPLWAAGFFFSDESAFERPQLLIRNEKPAYLFTTSQGGKYMTASPFIFKID